ncbi:MAG: Glycine reductase complex component B subunits alpha and beta [Syntrophorhabdus sp. PtaU1.Bin050]|nr:MAG: Glycine reductase complex component B subunits alpha and beta [Syntrophorhabdus sp. PtaU1.Bin050]
MILELGRIPVKEIAWGRKTLLEGTVLRVHREELIEKTKGDDPRITSVKTHIARPGESVRILPVKDVIEPRVKVEGKGGIFPGLISGVETVGSGCTHALQGCAVVTAGQVVGVQEGLIDMSGPGARYSAFSKTLNVVLAINVKHSISRHEHEEALRLAGLRAAIYLGEAGRNAKPVDVDRFEVHPPFKPKGDSHDLPGIVYVYMLLSQGLLHDTYLYGQNATNLLPTLIMGTEVMDGAVVSGNCVSACDKNTTYHHQNNPVIHELFKRDGIDLRFLGTVIGNCNVTLRDKMRSAQYGVKLVELLGADGAIITKEGFGNPDADAMMYCAGLEEKGIRTVMITDEFAGVDGASQSLADTTPQADAVVSTGNANERISLPPMDKVIGDIRIIERMAGGQSGSLSRESITVELQSILGATNELGFEPLSARGE